MACILFIDDDPITLNMLTKVAEFSGHRVITSVSAVEAIKVAASEKPDLIIVDMHMPDMDGLQVLRALRNQEETLNTPTLVLSAGAEVDVHERVRKAGGQAYLQKPLSLKKLLEVIGEYTGKH
jgi:two-component system cell cycle response regulator DivK